MYNKRVEGSKQKKKKAPGKQEEKNMITKQQRKNRRIGQELKKRVELIKKHYQGKEAWEKVEELHNELIKINQELENAKSRYIFTIEIYSGAPAAFRVNRRTYKAKQI